MAWHREERKRRKALIREAFRSANPFWRTWKEFALIASAIFAVMVILVLRAPAGEGRETAKFAGQLAGGALVLYSSFIYAPRRKTALDRAKEETIKKHGRDKYEMMKGMFHRKTIVRYDWLMWIAVLPASSLFLLLKSTLGETAILSIYAAAFAAFFLVRYLVRLKAWNQVEVEVEQVHFAVQANHTELANILESRTKQATGELISGDRVTKTSISDPLFLQATCKKCGIKGSGFDYDRYWKEYTCKKCGWQTKQRTGSDQAK